MKNTMRSLACLLLAGSLAAVGCGEGTGDKIEGQADTLANRVEEGMDNLGDRMSNDKDADAEFVSDAIEANTKEIRAIKLGQEKGSKEVKTHAGHMLADHKALGKEVEQYASGKTFTLDVDTSGIDNDLAEKQAGKDFDKAWANKMVDDHEKVISMFEDAQDDVKDPALKDMITKALPKLRSHLDMAKQLKEKLDK